MINLVDLFSVGCRGAMDNAFTLYFDGPGYDCRRWKLSFLFFWSFCFVLCFFRKTYFHFLTNLKYTGRLIAGSLSAFISKIQHKLALGTL